MRFNNLLRGLLVLLPALFMQAAALLATTHDTFTVTTVMTVTGAFLGFLGLRAYTRTSLRRRIPRKMHLIGMAIGVANCGNLFLLAPAVARLGIGSAMTIYALGAILVNARTDRGWRLLAVIGVSLVNRPWEIAQGDHAGAAAGLVLAVLAAASNWVYIKLVFGGVVPAQRRPRALGTGLAYTALFGAVIGLAGHYGFGLGHVPGWPQIGPIVLIGIMAWAIPGVAHSIAARLIPEEIAGFAFMLSTAVSATTGAIAAALGYVGDVQSPTLLGWIGVAVVLAVTARVTWTDTRRRARAAVGD